MIRNEVHGLLKNKIMIVVVLAVILIPFIYAGLFLKSMWDPYGNLSHLPVAVVNEDQAAEYKGRHLSIGEDLEEALQDNDSLDFHFIDKESAEKGLADGTWYMVITIPEDFSENAATVLDKEPREMELRYETNPGTNYIASKMSETAAVKIRDEIASQVTETYTQLMFEQIVSSGEGLREAADGSSELYGGIEAASSGSGKVAENLAILADSTLTFSDGTDTLSKGLEEYTRGVGQVNDGAAELYTGTSALAQKLPGLTGGIVSLDEGVRKYTGGVEALNDRSAELLSGSGELKEGSANLAVGLAAAQSGAEQYVGAVNMFADGTAGYIQGAGKLAAGASRLSGLENLGQISGEIRRLNASVSEGENSLKSETSKLEESAGAMYKQLQTVSGRMSGEELEKSLAAAAETGTAAARMSDDISDTAIQAARISASVDSAGRSISDTAARIEKAGESVSDVSEQTSGIIEECLEEADNKINSGNLQSKVSKENMTAAASDLEKIYRQLSEEGTAPEATLDSLQSVIGSLNSSADQIQAIPELDREKYLEDTRRISENMSDELRACREVLNHTSEDLKKTADSLNDQKAELEKMATCIADEAEEMRAISEQTERSASAASRLYESDFSALTETAGQLYEEAREVSAGTGKTADALNGLSAASGSFSEAAEGIRQLNQGFTVLMSGNEKLLSGIDSLKSAGKNLDGGIRLLNSSGQTISAGMRSFDSGVRTYTGGIALLAGSSSPLTEGTGQLVEGAAVLEDGMARFAAGTEELYAGTAGLNENSAALTEGAAALAGGAGQLRSGSVQLRDGAKELDSGMRELRDGAGDLHEGLKKGADEIGSLNTGEKNINMFASPVHADETQLTEVENNGHAMAPYMISVGLWVGCLAFCLMYPLTKYGGKLKSGFAWWGSKAAVLYPVAVLQGILLIALLHAADGFTPADMAKTVFLACLTAVAFTSIMYYFNITLGKVGSFLMLIFMVVQLSGSAGTYPVEISPPFVAAIHAYLPFTYTVNAFRSTISGGGSIFSSVILLAVLAVVFTGLTVIRFRRMARRRKNGQRLLIDWLEEKGLA